ncbi:HK97 gp10 family phage protein [uncultured Secundilactobacillus sp.]|uniref:HK97 gp10 family phage protein n=1 Tax=uncultured Secundilactobacillus sp. TaxID=2813935 RepID=UPI0025907B8E|nr:HK97 gp10 family phage protein [uncultured Secundilactobacillus sp.]
MELDAALTQWMAELDHATHLTIAEKATVTGAGAKVLANGLAEVIRQKHFRVHIKGRSDTHLANAVNYRKTDIDGEKTGVSSVGFAPDKAYIARFLNDGTKYIVGDHFVDQTREAMHGEVVKAERKAYRQIMQRKWSE